MPEVEKHEEEKKNEVVQPDIEEEQIENVVMEEKKPEKIELDVLPKTSDNIIFMFILLGINIIMRCLAIILKNKNN